MIRRTGGPSALILTLATAALASACSGGSARAGADDLAVAGKSRLTIDAAVELLATQAQLPPQSEVVLAVADLWVDYTLLAMAASEDPDLGNVDLTPLRNQRETQVLVDRLREEVITVDTALTEAALLEAYEADQPGLRVQASHILLKYPEQASQEQRDSVLALAAELGDRARAGEDFVSLVGQYSLDPGSAARGGDLGLFGAGDMVGPFEEAAFAQPVDGATDPVETPFGIHVIKVMDRQIIPLDSIREQFRMQLQGRRLYEAESTYVAGVRDPAQIEMSEDAYAVTRELALEPHTLLRGRAMDRPLVTFVGGTLTAGEIQAFLQGNPPSVRSQVANAPDEGVQILLSSLAQTELLAARAAELGLEYSAQEADSADLDLRIQLRNGADALGIRSIQPVDDETQAQAVDRAVLTALEAILAGRIDVVPLGPISFSLRATYGADVNEGVAEDVLTLVQAARDAAGAPVPEGSAPDPADPGN